MRLTGTLRRWSGAQAALDHHDLRLRRGTAEFEREDAAAEAAADHGDGRR
jgi:hypothetical protein